MAARKDIKAALLNQLRSMGADFAHFTDLVEDYMSLHIVKDKLLEDIRKRGVMYKDLSSTGVEMMKNNPSVKEVAMVNRQMLMILKELGLRTDKACGGGDNEKL